MAKGTAVDKETRAEKARVAKAEKARIKAEAEAKAKAKIEAEEKAKAEATPARALAPMEKRRTLLLARLKSPARYPHEQIQQFRVELKAMEKGTWRPGYKLPNKKTAIELFLDS